MARKTKADITGKIPVNKVKNKGSKATKNTVLEPEATQLRPFLDDNARRDIRGVIIAVVSIALFLTVVAPGQALLTGWISTAMHGVFGLGSYIVPIALFLWAITFFIRTDNPLIARVATGLSMAMVSILSMIAMFTPGVEEDPFYMFTAIDVSGANPVMSHGGYIGGALAWALLELVGRVVGMVFLTGLLLAAFVVIGLSISHVVLSMQNHISERRQFRNSLAMEEDDLYESGRPVGTFTGQQTSGRAEKLSAALPRRQTDLPKSPASHTARTALFDPDVLNDIPMKDAPTAGKFAAAMAENSKKFSSKRNDLADKTTLLPSNKREGGGGPIWKRPSRNKTILNGEAGSGVSNRDNTTVIPIADIELDKTSDLPIDENVMGSEKASGASSKSFVSTAKSAAAAAVTTKLVQDKADLIVHDVEKQKSKKPVSVLSKEERAARRQRGNSQAGPTPTENFILPAENMLTTSVEDDGLDERKQLELDATMQHLQSTLEEFGLSAKVVGWVTGPTVTMFKVEPGEGERVNKITNLEDDIALSLAAESVRIFAPIPGTSLIGIEIPNKNRKTVFLGEVLPHAGKGALKLGVGRDAEGNPVCVDLAKMPHLLIAGTTGSGKSVMINTIIMSILMRATPNEVRLIMVDPKRVELAGYNGIPQLYVPVVTEPRQAASALQWGVAEMDRRLKLFEKAGARNIGIYNKMIQEKISAALAEQQAMEAAVAEATEASEGVESFEGEFAEAAVGKTTVLEGVRPEDSVGKNIKPAADLEEMPYLVIVIDELSDLMMVAGKDVEASIVRIAQLGRAAGIHLIVATQRPSSDIVTGLIKANITNRIAFNVATGTDSRVIIDQNGAEKLIGLGDMLFSKPEWGKPKRIQGCFASDDEIEDIIDYVRTQGEPDYHEEILSVVLPSAKSGNSGALEPDDEDPLLWEAGKLVVESGMGSTSGLQRRLKVGYARAGRIMDMLEVRGVVGPPDGSKPREVLITDVDDLNTIRDFEKNEEV